MSLPISFSVFWGILWTCLAYPSAIQPATSARVLSLPWGFMKLHEPLLYPRDTPLIGTSSYMHCFMVVYARKLTFTICQHCVSILPLWTYLLLTLPYDIVTIIIHIFQKRKLSSRDIFKKSCPTSSRLLSNGATLYLPFQLVCKAPEDKNCVIKFFWVLTVPRLVLES